LNKGIPIGSIRDTPSDRIQKMLNGDDSEFENAKKSISERSTSLWEILNTAWIYKISNIIPRCFKIIFEENDIPLYEKITKLGELHKLCDDRILKSIEASELVQLIENKLQ
jgi:hypothetical protein